MEQSECARCTRVARGPARRHGPLIALASALAIGGCVPATRGAPIAMPVSEGPPPQVTVPLPPAPTDPEPAPQASDSAGTARLLRLSYVWHLVSLHHPHAQGRGVPLDSAFIRAVTLVRRANDPAALDVAYARFLAVLNDPLTRVERDGAPSWVRPTSTEARVATERTQDSILLLRVPTATRYADGSEATLRSALNAVPSRVVLDLRTPESGADPDSVAAFVARAQLAERLATTPFTQSSVRVRRVGGAVETPQGWRFDDAWRVQDGALVSPTAAQPAPRRLVVLANEHTVFAPAVLGLMASQRATVVVERTGDGALLRDDALVPSVEVPIGQGLRVRLRVGELVHADGSTGLMADTAVARVAGSDAPLTAAYGMLRSGRLVRASRLPPVRAAAQLPGYYDTDPYPYMGSRVLGGARVWSVMRARHAHRDLYDDDIDDVFERALPRLESARYANEYAAALVGLAASFDDAQASVTGASVDTVLGVATFPFRVRWADGHAVISDVLADSAVRALQLQPGQEITVVDGFPIGAWTLDMRRRVSAPNDWSRQQQLASIMRRGPEGTSLVRVRDVTGRERQLAVPRRTAWNAIMPQVERPLQPSSLALPSGLAYLDVNRLTEQTVQQELQRHRGARAWILDLRGALPDTSMVGAAVLNAVRARDAAVIARELHRYQSTPCLSATLREASQQCSDERETRARVSRGDTVTRYRGRLVALVDERTVGAMERLALALEGTTDVTFVGSATAGSPAEPVRVPLPGGLTLRVPAAELRRTDGSQWQRVGITPVVEARTTLRTYRNGVDEVLQRAQEWLVQQLDGRARRR